MRLAFDRFARIALESQHDGTTPGEAVFVPTPCFTLCSFGSRCPLLEHDFRFCFVLSVLVLCRTPYTPIRTCGCAYTARTAATGSIWRKSASTPLR